MKFNEWIRLQRAKYYWNRGDGAKAIKIIRQEK